LYGFYSFCQTNGVIYTLPRGKLFVSLADDTHNINLNRPFYMKELTAAIEHLQADFNSHIDQITTLQELENVRIMYLGRKGKISDLMLHLKNLSLEEKHVAGPLLNALKQTCTTLCLSKEHTLEKDLLAKELEKDAYFDVTMYKTGTSHGSLHPITHVLERVESIFTSMGFVIADGPEVETEFYNFDALNIPKNHPARDMWDTFWLDVPGFLLRTHTSPVQIHQMLLQGAPLAIAAPGRCYRHEATDASHDIVFMQVEGLLIGENISMGNLLATVKHFLRTLFDKKDLEIRVRPSFFPFVEPGVEIDASCPLCTQGCSLCKHSGWIEICGAGLVHPNVLKAGGIDVKTYSAFAFGFGLTRLAMLLYRIDDIRLLHNPKIEFLTQF
jgi:phenylalanyl-tRNA synthetase alpha chain